MQRIILFLLILSISAIGVDAQKRKSKRLKKKRPPAEATWNGGYNSNVREPIVRTSNLAFAINANSWTAHPVFVGTNTLLEGRYNAQGGSKNDIEVYILDEDGLTNFRNGNSAPTFYNSNGGKTVGNFTVSLSGEKFYYIVFKNSAWIASKAVTLTLTETNFLVR